MKKILSATILATMLSSTVVHAQAAIEGVWSTQEGCDVLNYKGNEVPKNFDVVSFLTNNDVSGHEWICEFTQKNHTKYGSTIAISACAMEGDEWPELIMITPRDTGWNLIVNKGNGNEPNVLEFPVQCRKEIE